MIEPADAPTELPRITLAGKAWPIPELLGWRQLSRCRRQLLDLNARIGEAIDALPQAEGEGDDARIARHMQAMAEVFDGLENDAFDELVIGPLYVALTALHPALQRDEFDAWPVTETERQWAWLGVRRRSGLFIVREVGEPNPEGETTGGALAGG